MDQVFREYLLQLISVWDVEILKKYVQYNVELCRADLSTPSSPVILLSDIFDMSTLEFCESLFSFVEMNVYVWKEDMFFGVCKNNLLRMCNGIQNFTKYEVPVLEDESSTLIFMLQIYCDGYLDRKIQCFVEEYFYFLLNSFLSRNVQVRLVASLSFGTPGRVYCEE